MTTIITKSNGVVAFGEYDPYGLPWDCKMDRKKGLSCTGRGDKCRLCHNYTKRGIKR